MRTDTKIYIAITLFLLSFVFVSDTFGHHGNTTDTYPVAVKLDKQAVSRCDRFRYEGKSPSREWCMSILYAVHVVREPGRKANRTWVYNPALLKLASHESSFAHAAMNPTSKSCGIGQMLPCDKYGEGSCWPQLRRQAKCFIRYILRRYRTPERAWAFWQANGWY